MKLDMDLLNELEERQKTIRELESKIVYQKGKFDEGFKHILAQVGYQEKDQFSLIELINRVVKNYT